MGESVKSFVSAVVYVRNDEDTLFDFLMSIGEELRSNFSEVEIICVDDASEDDSLRSIRNASMNLDDIDFTVIRLGFFHGREAAIRAGDDISIGDYIIEFDNAVLNFMPHTIITAYKTLVEGYDIVGAVPLGKRRLSSKFFYKAINNSPSVANSLDTETFRILSRRALNRVESSSQIIPYRKALYANSGLPQQVIQHEPTHFNERAMGKKGGDKRERRHRVDVAIEAIVLFTQTGYKLTLGLSFFMMAVALFMIAYSFYCYFAGLTVAGWTTTILFLAFAFFGLFGILSIVIKYLQIIVNLIFKKKPYMLESVERLVNGPRYSKPE